MEQIVSRQEKQVKHIFSFLRDITTVALATDRDGIIRPQPVGFKVQQFGSRVYRCELPGSDVDVAGAVRQECTNALGLTKAEIMGRLQEQQ